MPADPIVAGAGEAPLSDGPALPRRAWLTHAGMAGLLVGCGLIGVTPARAAAELPFDATLMKDVLRGLGGDPVPSDAIDLELPELTENGAMVPVSVTSRLPRTDQILLVVEANPYPLVARFDVGPGMEPYIATRVKLAQSCSVCAIVRADGRLYAVARDTAVTQGGCGG